MSNIILNTLLEKINNAELISQGDFNILEFDLYNIELKDYLSYFSANEKFYFQDKEASTEILGLNIFKKNIDLTMSLKNNPQATILSYEKFSQNEKAHKTWDRLSLGHHYFKFCFKKIGLKTTCQILLTSDMDSQQQLTELVYDLHTLFLQNHSYLTSNGIESSLEAPDFKSWDTMISKSLQLFTSSELKKIVLNRNIENTYKDEINPYEYFTKLTRSSENSYQVFIKLDSNNYFLSITPERLLKIRDNLLEIDSIAGTIKRGEDQSSDDQLGKELLADAKEVEEHEIVTRSILETVSKYTQDFQLINNKSILKLKYIQHIHSKITAKVSTTDISSLKSDLHPTPAVGGHPKESAIKRIKEIEPQARGLYASPIGYYSTNASEVCVGIRSALITSNKMTIYGGCGVVKESTSHREWLETKNKMKNFESIIG